jgi:hypothetical protein
VHDLGVVDVHKLISQVQLLSTQCSVFTNCYAPFIQKERKKERKASWVNLTSQKPVEKLVVHETHRSETRTAQIFVAQERKFGKPKTCPNGNNLISRVIWTLSETGRARMDPN